MSYVHIEDIEVPQDRVRKDFDRGALDELKESILNVGLIHPLTVEKNGDGWILRAGERRLKVLQEIFVEGGTFRHGTEICGGLDFIIPIVEWNDLTALQRLEIEVDENLKRVDFAWQERIQGIEKLHKMRQLQNPQQTITATAQEVAQRTGQAPNLGIVSDALIISRHLSNPDVAKAKDPKEAMKIIKKQAEILHNAKLAKEFNPVTNEHTLILGDCLGVLPTLQEESFDVILTDPPYGVGADNFGSQSGTGHDYEDSNKYLEDLLKELPDQLFRVAKKRSHCYLFCDVRRFERLATLMVLAKWQVFPTPLIWSKANGMVPLPKHGPRRTYECILYAYKGDRETLVLKNDCITHIGPVRNPKHGAQKPVALYCELLSRSARPGDVVLDCFGGVGTILVAANKKKLKATYIEKAEHFFNIAKQRQNIQEPDDGAEDGDELDIPF